MPCDFTLKPRQTQAERDEEIRRAVKSLEAKLLSKQANVVIAPNGAIAFSGWGKDRDGVADVCAYRKLTAQGSFALRQAVATAEAMTGRKVNLAAIGAGHHSHDGGKTWGTH